MKKGKKIENIKDINRVLRCKKALNFGKVLNGGGFNLFVFNVKVILTISVLKPLKFLYLMVDGLTMKRYILLLILILCLAISSIAMASNWVEVAPKLGDETRIYSLAVYNNKIYGGTYPNGKLYEWNGTNAWVEVAPQLGDEEYIYALAVYNSKLYGTTYDNGTLVEWDDDDEWVEVAPKLGDETRHYALAVFNGKLYAGTTPNGKLYEWNDSNLWVEVAPQLDGETHIFSLAVYDSKLYGGTYDDGRLYEWNGTNAWVEVAPKLGDENRITSLAVHNNKLYGGTGVLGGKLYEWNDSNLWVEVAPKLGDVTIISSLAVYNNKLYGGAYPDGKLYEWDDDDEWVEVAPKLGDETFINALVVYNGKLYGGTGLLGGALYEWSGEAPTVTIQAVSSIEATTATGNGNITNRGSEDCDKRGFVYGTTTQSDPGTTTPASSGYDSYAEDTGTFGTGAFTKGLTGLTPGTKYYIRAYAHNSVDYNYSDTELEFTTDIIIYYAQQSTSINDDSAWQPETEIGRDSSGFGHMSLVPMGSEKVMALYNDYDGSNYNLKYRIYDGSWGATSTVVTDCKDNTAEADWDEHHWFSAIADSSNNVHVVYVDSDDNDLNYIYYNGSSWSSAQEIYTGTVTHPSLSYDSTTGNLVAFFIEGNAVKYKVKDSGSWGDPSGGTTVKAGLDSPTYLGSAYSDATSIGIIWRETSSSPYAISYAILTLSEARSDIMRIKGGVRLKGGLRLK